MARKTPVPPANQEVVLECTHQNCSLCGHSMWNDYDNERTIRTLSGVVRLTLKVRRCTNRECERYHQVYRPESEGSWALPEHEFGLDAIATKIKTFTAQDLVLLDLSAWRQKRDQMKQLRHNRLQQRRFRRQTETYLAELETKLIQSILPP